MTKSHLTLATIVALSMSGTAMAQSDVDKAFTATGASCDQITWSDEALENYPQISSACQDVVERDGRYYVKFSGSVQRVADRGRTVTVDFKNGSRLALTPPENMSLYIDGQPKTTRSLRRGDELTFYVPQDELAAAPETRKTMTLVEGNIIPVTRIRVVEIPVAQSSTDRTSAAQLPATASVLPLMGLCGLLLTSVGAVLTMRRRLR